MAVAAFVGLVSLAISPTPTAHSWSGSVYESTASIVYVRASERALVEALGPGTGKTTRAIDITGTYSLQYSLQIESTEFASAVAAQVGSGVDAADVSRAVNVSTSAAGSLIHIRVQWADPRLAASIATAIARRFVDSQMTARLHWVSDYRDMLSTVDRRSLLVEPPDPATLLADPLYVADVSPAIAIMAEPRREALWQAPWARALLVLLIGAGAAVAYERAKARVITAEKLGEATNVRRLGFTAATRSENATTVAVDLAKALRAADRNGVVVTSPGRGDGKTTAAIDLARFHGASGLKVIVVETDFLGGGVDERLRAGPARTGLADLLVSEVPIGPNSIDQLLEATNARGVRLLPRGVGHRRARARLGSDRMKAIIRELGNHADLVLYDSPAAPAVHDAATLANMAGASLLVVREDWTSMAATRAAIHDLSAAGAPILGFAYIQQPSLWSVAGEHAIRVAHAVQDARRVPLKRAMPAIAHILLPLLPGR